MVGIGSHQRPLQLGRLILTVVVGQPTPALALLHLLHPSPSLLPHDIRYNTDVSPPAQQHLLLKPPARVLWTVVTSRVVRL